MARIILTLAGDITAQDLAAFSRMVTLHMHPDATVYIGDDPNTSEGPTVQVLIDTSPDEAVD